MDPIEQFRGRITHATKFYVGEKYCTTARINEDGDIVVVANHNTAYGYNLFTEKCYAEFAGHDGHIEDIAIAADSSYVVTVGASRHVIFHDLTTGEVMIDHDLAQMISCCDLSPPMLKRLYVVSSKQGKQNPKFYVMTVDYPRASLVRKFDIPIDYSVRSMRTLDDDSVVLGTEDGQLLFISISNKAIVKTVNAHKAAINFITISPDHKFFVTASSETVASAWPILDEGYDEETEYTPLATYRHNMIVSCAAISPIAPHVVLASSDVQSQVARTSIGSTSYTINFFNTIMQEEFASMKVHMSTVNWVGFTPDGYTLCTVSSEGTLMVVRLGADYKEFIRQHKGELNNYLEQFKYGE